MRDNVVIVDVNRLSESMKIFYYEVIGYYKSTGENGWVKRRDMWSSIPRETRQPMKGNFTRMVQLAGVNSSIPSIGDEGMWVRKDDAGEYQLWVQ